ncbi:hypothetical protein OIU76_000724 [Salix suchowensis]|nr:hypothetical protein OIU76_000724 [Salix suchowensis]
MQRFVDTVLAVIKESVKTVTYESLNNIARLINGVSAILLTILPAKANVLEGLQGWELRPTFRGPRLPRWMENGVSSFNKFIHELPMDSDTSSVDYSSAEEDGDGMYPPTPSSQCSRMSRSSTFSKNYGHSTGWTIFFFSWILFPLRFLLGVPIRFCRLFYIRRSTASPRGSHQNSPLHGIKKIHSLRDHVIHRTTDRRRGVIEDLNLAIEVFIEVIFDFFHKAAHFLLSPSEVIKAIWRWFLSWTSRNKDIRGGVSDTSIPAATLGEDDPAPTEMKTTLHNSLNTDARTCQDVITELGYPYEAIHVITSDGYVLLLERIPRRDSRKAVYLQHGILDSSMGLQTSTMHLQNEDGLSTNNSMAVVTHRSRDVQIGIVGCPMGLLEVQLSQHMIKGYDVFLGNFSGLVSREHIEKKISSQKYWRYSINEHGTEDIPAMIEKIHQVKSAELKISQPDLEEDTNDDQHYKLCAISHSLGGAAMLMYLITSRIEEKSHRLSRLILLSPAGFHHDSSLVFTAFEYMFLPLAPILACLVPAFYIPTRFFRMLLNKLARDFHNYPAVGGLVQTLMSYVVGGDSSNWVGVIGLPHYNMNDMPGVSFYVAHHLAQMKRSKKFRMYDYGSASANMDVYGSPEPLDLGEYYGLIDIPVDLVAGKRTM